MKIKKYQVKRLLLLTIVAIYLGLFYAHWSEAEPAGAQVNNPSTDTGNGSSPDSRTDPGGTITTIDLSVTQQNTAWKAYVGNITGTLVLRNTGGFSIYEWALDDTALGGTVFIARASSITWGSLNCSNQTIIDAEDTFMGNNGTTSSINTTFNETIHSTMSVSGISPIPADTCRATATYVNDTRQSQNANTTFQELVLQDNQSNLIFGTFIYQDSDAYNNNDTNNTDNTTYDFQLIVAENRSNSAGTTYYFYADIS